MRLAVIAAISLPVLLAGCSMGPTAPSTATTGLAIQGSVYGGEQAIVGAHVYLLAASTAGYGSASVPLLTNVAGKTTLDTSGGPTDGDYYVTTDSAGGFTITGDYTCTQNTQVYLYTLGGMPGGGTANPNAAVIAALGNCPASGSLAGAVPFVDIDEVSTIAAAYAFSGFATDATHVASSNTAAGQLGIANAFAFAGILANVGKGTANAATADGHGVIPQSKINTLADILVSCVNSAGATIPPADPTTCNTLFNNATAGGTPTGTVPTDTANAAINMAHNPGSNVATLYGLVTGTPPFLPKLTAVPNDLSLAITYTGGGMNGPNAIAVDANGKVWITSEDGGGDSFLTTISSSGTVTNEPVVATGTNTFEDVAINESNTPWVVNFGQLPPVFTISSIGTIGNVYSGSTLFESDCIAFDASGTAWIAGASGIATISSSGVVSTTAITGGGLDSPLAMAFDSAGSLWIANSLSSAVSEISSGGVIRPTPYTGGGIGHSRAIAIDASDTVWIAGLANNSVATISNGVVNPTPFTGGGLAAPVAIAMDGVGTAWIANQTNDTITTITNSGTVRPTPYAEPTLSAPSGLAIDGSGNVWVTNAESNNVMEFVGAAAPVVTPLSVAVKNKMIATRP
jgi:hypothetical protein